MTTEPTTGEVARRVDALKEEMREGIRGLNERLDKMPTSQLLTAYLAKTDADVRAVDTKVDAVKADVVDLERQVETSVADLERQVVSAVSALEKKITDGRRWAIGALISSGGLLVAVVGLIRTFAS